MYNKILVPLDGSELAECVLPHVQALANGCEVKELIFFRVVQPSTFELRNVSKYTLKTDDFPHLLSDEERFQKAYQLEAMEYLNGVIAKMAFSVVKASPIVEQGQPADKIADYAKSQGVDLIIIATHGRSGPSRWLLGSVADRVLRASCVPVFMIRAPGCFPGIS